MPRYTDRQLAILRNKMGENVPVPPLKKKRDNPEHRMQAALCDWWHHAHKGLGIPEHLLFAIPNGGWRDPIGAKNLKREGQRNGAPDLMLAVSREGWAGAFIEMKAPDGVVSDAQRAFLKDAGKEGYAVRVCYSVESAMGFITRYLAGEEF